MARRVPINDPRAAIVALKADGGVILTGFASALEIQQVNTDAQPYIDEILDRRIARYAPNPPPPEWARCNLLFGRSTTAREKWLQQIPLLQIINHFLRTVSIPYNDDEDAKIETDAILSASSTLDVRPGVEAQRLHRDDFIWQWRHDVKGAQVNAHGGDGEPALEGIEASDKRNEGNQYRMGQDICMGLLVPGVETCIANGATMFVPGSHLWDHYRRPQREDVKSAEMFVGEAFLFLGSTVHAGGQNTTKNSRPTHGFFFCRSWMRPEENMHLYFTKEEVSRWSTSARKQAGYMLDGHFLGHCDEKNPIDLFRAATRDDMNGAMPS